MARTINKLSAQKAANLKKEGMHSDGGGLYLRIADGNRYWVFRYASRTTGKDRQLGIGPTHTFSLAEAREKARQYRQALAEGRDPLDERRAQEASNAVEAAKGGMTFDACGDAYIAAHEKTWSSLSHRNQWETTLSVYVSPIIGKLPVKAIDTGLVLKVLEPIWTDKTETASRIRSRIELILDWAKVRGYRDGENPARWKGHLQHSLGDRKKIRKVEHHAAVPFSEIGAFVAELRTKEGIAAKALEFLILTATRSGEVLGATWDEFDLNAKVWTIPAERMKARREHKVPLSPAAIAVIEQMKAIKHDPTRIFPVARIDRQLWALRPDATVHGFRSTFRDWAAECAHDLPPYVAEMALAHAIASGVEAAYRRGDLLALRAKLMDRWATYCSAPEVAANNVIPMRAKEVPA